MTLNIAFTEPEGCYSNYWLNTIICENQNRRDEFLSITNTQNVMTRPAWTSMHKLPMFQGALSDNLLNTLWLEDRIVNLPSSVIIE